MQQNDTLSWGWKEFARKDRIVEPDRGYIFDVNKIQVELELKNVKLFYEEEIPLPSINPQNPFTVLEGRQFTIAWVRMDNRFLINGPIGTKNIQTSY